MMLARCDKYIYLSFTVSFVILPPSWRFDLHLGWFWFFGSVLIKLCFCFFAQNFQLLFSFRRMNANEQLKSANRNYRN